MSQSCVTRVIHRDFLMRGLDLRGEMPSRAGPPLLGFPIFLQICRYFSSLWTDSGSPILVLNLLVVLVHFGFRYQFLI